MKILRQHWLVKFVFLIVISGLALTGCATEQADSGNTATANPIETIEVANTTLPTLEGKATVVMRVNGSPITIEVNGDEAPITGGNFVDLVSRGFYDGLTFHRVVKQPQPFVAQGGDPLGNGTGGFEDPDTSRPRYIPLEIKPEGADKPVYSKTLGQAGIAASPVLEHTRGAVAMARSQMPDSASSQFYFALADLSFLDGNYAVFGYVTDGMDVVDSIEQGDRIESAEVVSGLENLKKS